MEADLLVAWLSTGDSAVVTAGLALLPAPAPTLARPPTPGTLSACKRLERYLKRRPQGLLCVLTPWEMGSTVYASIYPATGQTLVLGIGRPVRYII